MIGHVSQAALLLVAALFAGKWLNRVVPGPATLRALTIAVGLAAARAALASAGRIVVAQWPDWPGDLTGARFDRALFAGRSALTVWIAWALTAWTGSLLWTALIGAIATQIFRAFGSWLFFRSSTPVEKFDDDRRLQRFAAQVAARDLRFAWLADSDHRPAGSPIWQGAMVLGALRRRPTLVIARWLYDLPEDILYAVGAHAIVQGRRAARITREAIWHAPVLFFFALAALGSDRLARAVGAPSVHSPAFVPVIAGVVAAAGGTYFELRRVAEKHVSLVGPTLDLTRDPETLLALLKADGGSAATIAATVAAVDKWKRSQRVCLLFTDIVGSTALLDGLGDEKWDAVIFHHDRVLRDVFDRRGGTVLDRAGDGFAVAFEDTGSALLAATEAQVALRDVKALGAAVPVRIGCHAGDVIRRREGLVGREMHIAARVCGLAGGGEILVTDEVMAEVADSERFRFGPRREEELRGFSEPHGVALLLVEA